MTPYAEIWVVVRVRAVLLAFEGVLDVVHPRVSSWARSGQAGEDACDLRPVRHHRPRHDSGATWLLVPKDAAQAASLLIGRRSALAVARSVNHASVGLGLKAERLLLEVDHLVRHFLPRVLAAFPRTLIERLALHARLDGLELVRID